MKLLLAFCMLISIPILIVINPIKENNDGWEQVGEGIEYKEFHLPDPNNVYVARLDRNNPHAIIDSALANGELGSGSEVISKMARLYDQAINSWDGETWGARNQVVVAINGSYVDRQGFPQSGQITSGWYAKRFDDKGGGSGFAWKLDRSAFIGGCVFNNPEKQYIQNLVSKDTQLIAGVNVYREPEGLFLYTPQWGSNTGTLNAGVEILVKLSRPTTIYPGPDLSITGTVQEIRDMSGSTYIPFDSIVLSARGQAREKLLNLVKVGDGIGINQELSHFDSDCKTRRSESWTTTYASVSGDYVFLKDGEIIYYDNAGYVRRHPRTAIVYNNDYIYFIVVDGRRKDVSIGMTIQELGIFAYDTLGATWGIALDGGGSSTMVVNGVVKNHPSDPCHQIYAPVIGVSSSSTGARQISPPPQNRSTAGSSTCERPVVNGMLMISVEPKVQSRLFSAGDQVIAARQTSLRLGPGTNYSEFATIPFGTTGKILTQNDQLEGVLAKGYYWWKVSFAGVEGWVDQGSLVKALLFPTVKAPMR